MRHNNRLPNAHFRKHWQNRVKTWFNQPAKKVNRRKAREKKSKAQGTRTDTLLRPSVHCPTIRYNRRLRLGRGFSLDELEAAKIPRTQARRIGIAVDHRRKNRSEESFDRNVQRLKAYQEKLFVFPSKRTDNDMAVELPAFKKVRDPNTLIPLSFDAPAVEARKILASERQKME